MLDYYSVIFGSISLTVEQVTTLSFTYLKLLMYELAVSHSKTQFVPPTIYDYSHRIIDSGKWEAKNIWTVPKK